MGGLRLGHSQAGAKLFNLVAVGEETGHEFQPRTKL